MGSLLKCVSTSAQIFSPCMLALQVPRQLCKILPSTNPPKPRSTQRTTRPKFRYEDIRKIRDLFQKGDYFFKLDIKSEYHHINILEADHKYLAFSWEIDGVTRYFAFTFLVFCIHCSFIFTKAVKVLIKHWRSKGIPIFGFVDDFLGGSHSYQDTKEFLTSLKKICLKVALL